MRQDKASQAIRVVLSCDVILKCLTDYVQKVTCPLRDCCQYSTRISPQAESILHPPSSRATSGYPYYLLFTYAAVFSSRLQRVAAPRASI